MRRRASARKLARRESTVCLAAAPTAGNHVGRGAGRHGRQRRAYPPVATPYIGEEAGHRPDLAGRVAPPPGWAGAADYCFGRARVREGASKVTIFLLVKMGGRATKTSGRTTALSHGLPPPASQARWHFKENFQI
jgi:hypothetical protein